MDVVKLNNESTAWLVDFGGVAGRWYYLSAKSGIDVCVTHAIGVSDASVRAAPVKFPTLVQVVNGGGDNGGVDIIDFGIVPSEVKYAIRSKERALEGGVEFLRLANQLQYVKEVDGHHITFAVTSHSSHDFYDASSVDFEAAQFTQFGNFTAVNIKTGGEVALNARLGMFLYGDFVANMKTPPYK